MKRLLPAGHGFEFICFLLETWWGIPMLCLFSGIFVSWMTSGGYVIFFLGSIFGPLFVLFCSVTLLFSISHYQGTGTGSADWSEYIKIKDERLRKKYEGKKIPMDIMYEAYMHEELDIKKDVYDTLLRRNDLFSFSFSLENSIRFFFGTLLGTQVFDHSQSSDKSEVKPVYDRGNDFYNWFLGESMVYTCGIFQDENEKLETAQNRKMDTICQSLHMKKGDEHLDIGCGWGTLLRHAVQNFGTNSTGVTLAQNQKEYHEQVCKENNIKNANSLVMDYRDLPPMKKYNSITCVEMAEHVGIKNFQKFLLQVRNLLTDDGLFYLQIAGLRRTWQFEDLVWGIFMGQYIFPAADASCPLGFVTTQLERAGFEVHRVENTGVHYSLTLKKWYNNWMGNKEKVIEKYGQYWFRMWSIFLAWSSIIAAQGSSTVFMITCNKNHKNDARSIYNGKKINLFSRTDTFVGKDIIAIQQ